jgi:hypothetical protein
MLKLANGTHLALDAIHRHVYGEADDLVIVAGTLIEGIGNRFSDVDVYVIGERRPRVAEVNPSRHLRVLTVERKIVGRDYAQTSGSDEEVLLVHGESEVSGVKIDVEYQPLSVFDDLAGKIDRIFAYARSHLLLLTIGLSEREKMFLHRLRFCHVIQGSAKYRNVTNMVSYARYNYLLYRWMASDYSVFLDIVGAGAAGEWARAIELARGNVLQQTLAFLNLIGVSNFDPKWLLTYLEHTETLGYLDGPTLASFRCLYYYSGIDPDDTRSLMAYVERSLDFADTIFWYSRSYLLRNPLLPNFAEAKRLLNAAEDEDGAGLYEAVERIYRSKVYGLPAVSSTYLLRVFLTPGTTNE